MLGRLAFIKLLAGTVADLATRPAHPIIPEEAISSKQKPEEYERDHKYIEEGFRFTWNPRYPSEGIKNEFRDKPVNRDTPIDLDRIIEEKDVVILTYGSDRCPNTEHQVRDFNAIYGDGKLEIIFRAEYSDDPAAYV